MHEETVKKNEKAFNKAYNSWKELAKEIRMKLKNFCSTEDLDTKLKEIKAKEALVHQQYESICRNHSTTQYVVKRMDACTALTAEICDLTSKRLENVDGIFDDQHEKERVRMST
ncbi:Hypothetical predicted protein [Pelobates cultripes]|uniref:Uncharacterized protein n=1 Tax=Pelobates cultripes TaxID=61616 RepID=A0AAD1R116_PELCU|nr:Hypothetical predicted protein [Pelobates cultripes]